MDFKSFPCSRNATLCIIPPIEYHSYFQQIRKNNDKSYKSIPPHITIIYPYVSESSYSKLCSEFFYKGGSKWSKVKPFRLKCRKQVHNETNSKYVSLAFDCVDSKGNMLKENMFSQMQSILLETFPQCSSTGSKNHKDDAFVPHLTLGQFKQSDMKQTITQLNQFNWESIEFKVDQIHILTRKSQSSSYKPTVSIPINP